MTTIGLALLPLLWPALASIALSLATWGVLVARKALAEHARTAPLSDVIDVAGQALDAAIKAAGTSGPTPAAIKAAETAAFNLLAAHRGELEADALAELHALVSHAVALKAGAPISLPSGLVANAPAPTAGMALLPVLGLLSGVTFLSGCEMALGAVALGLFIAYAVMKALDHCETWPEWKLRWSVGQRGGLPTGEKVAERGAALLPLMLLFSATPLLSAIDVAVFVAIPAACVFGVLLLLVRATWPRLHCILARDHVHPQDATYSSGAYGLRRRYLSARPAKCARCGASFARIRPGPLSAALLALLSIWMAAPARAQTIAKPAAYSASLLGSALKFPWSGASAVQVAPGVGAQLSWDPPLRVTLPVLGDVPLLSVGGAVVGSLVQDPSAPYSLSVGPLLQICHLLGIGLLVDLAAGGGTDRPTGLVTGRVGLPNVSGLLFYSWQPGAVSEASIAPGAGAAKP